MHGTRFYLDTLLVGMGLLASVAAHAACSRVIQVPMSATGQSVLIDGDTITGIYPDLLRSLSEKEDCTFATSGVPRARQEILFETGHADLLVPATKTPKRDALGTFVALIHNRVALWSIQSNRAAIKTVSELQDNSKLKVALVRGSDYGPVYQELIVALGKQGRLILEVDALSVARLLKSGTADVTIMASTILAGAVQGDDRVRDVLDKLRLEPLEELPWGVSGIYISNTALNPQDRAVLQDALERVARSGEVWKAFQRRHSPTILKGSVRPL
jgi:polar amino acid transport system substrate-binding protein